MTIRNWRKSEVDYCEMGKNWRALEEEWGVLEREIKNRRRIFELKEAAVENVKLIIPYCVMALEVILSMDWCGALQMAY